MRHLLLFATLLFAASAQAETPRDFLTRFEKEAGATASTERGASDAGSGLEANRRRSSRHERRRSH
ncbi:MAG: hypothetical protein K9J74_04565 [Sulfuritalea sp.]|nr:hypothetical protein [Sulfuritalea sp.]